MTIVRLLALSVYYALKGVCLYRIRRITTRDARSVCVIK